jgi:ubiquinone/menaquinone biosynthesis C-methylase UbiE
MSHKFDVRNKHKLLADERHEELQPETLLRSLGLQPGDTIADIGCGPGFFTIPAARIVGEQGHVFAADIQGEMLTAVRSSAAERGLTNVQLVKTSDTEIPLPPESCDVALLAFVLHEVPQRSLFLLRVAHVLKPTGRVAVLEWEKVAEPHGPPVEERIARDELLADAEAAGLRLEETREITPSQYLSTFVRVTH